MPRRAKNKPTRETNITLAGTPRPHTAHAGGPGKEAAAATRAGRDSEGWRTHKDCDGWEAHKSLSAGIALAMMSAT